MTTVTQINDEWQKGSNLKDLPGMQAEVQAFIPSGKDNRKQIAPIQICTIWAKDQPVGRSSQHINLNYISGSRNNQNTHVGYQVRLRYLTTLSYEILFFLMPPWVCCQLALEQERPI